MLWGIIGLSLVFTWSLCKAAALGDEKIEDIEREE